MAIKAHSGMTPEWYTPDSQEGMDDATRFRVVGLTGAELLELNQYMDSTTGAVQGPGLVQACRVGLKGWENVVDEEGRNVTFNRIAIARLPAEIIAEVGAKIISLSVLDDEETKNS